MNFQKTPNLLQNFFDTKKVFVFDTFKKKIEEITQEEFFKLRSIRTKISKINTKQYFFL